MPRNCHFVNVHHAYPEGLLVVERENRESLLLIGARSRPQKKKKTGAKRMRRKRGEGRDGKKKRLVSETFGGGEG